MQITLIRVVDRQINYNFFTGDGEEREKKGVG